MRRLALLTFVFCFACEAAAAVLPMPVRTALKQAGIPLSAVGIVAQQTGARSPLISVNAKQAMNPASTMKLLTAYAGLELLGPAYAWKTEAYLDGELKDGVLQGNLVLKGYGDPKLTLEQFWLWLRELRARGLREIRGDLVLDRSFFELPPHDPAAFDNDPVRAYNVGPDALLLNFNTLRLRYLPNGNGMKIISEPALEGIRLDNLLAPQPAPNCDNWDDTIRVQPEGDSVVLQGGYPGECGEREHNLSVIPHTRYVEALFRTLWHELGGTLQGKARDGSASANAQLLSTHHSAPLAEVIRDINKFSNNVMARQLFLTLGTAGGTGPANLERSTRAVQAWLSGKHLDFPELALENGAGLSRMERISALHLAQLLQSAAQSPLGPELAASLPILGVDGSVKKRLKGSPAAGHAHLKTGTLEGVKTLAGYVRSRSGREWVVVFLINHPNAKFGQGAQDTLIEWLQQQH
ncbi:D-alanyl-D-alanine carboxypeptidase [Ferrigenium kumadai]|uniref:D-alanyl-D-alanine carboxypeptidase n=1 Tax=Ferrigenium kumadai TaxID=1682490 RepID=A0AAN1VYW1_9PROT|nr:D-alanyl-D-alanine carboxypeptidase/D-alanyl-D-alanine-endopeptidase [Ferrigenium kumadai]BBI98525.1 D-alanyl-D-alanine carboxypeptidase [Ferrigenium kumadai]